MKLVGRVPVEPLDDERLTNIERRIVAGAADAMAKHREPRFSLTFGFAAATVVVVLGAGLIGWKLRGGNSTEVADATPLHVHTEALASTLDIGDARITSDPSTTFDVTRPDGGVLIQMKRGKVALEVSKRGNRAPLVVRAGDTDVEVVGTQFSVDYGDGTGEVDVKVSEGVVKVKQKTGGEQRVAAGDEWKLDKSGEAKFIPAELAANDKTTTIVVPPIGKDIGLHDRVAQVPNARMPTAPTPGSNLPDPLPELLRPPVVDAPTKLKIDLRNAIKSQPVLPALDLNLPAAQAVAEYRKLAAFGTQGAAPNVAQASEAFYSIAVVQHFTLGRNSDALTTLDAYFRRFRPNTKEYQPARWLQVRARCLPDGKALKIDDACRQAAYTYAHEFPGTPAARTAELLAVASD
jgi:hypothetical protein